MVANLTRLVGNTMPLVGFTMNFFDLPNNILENYLYSITSEDPPLLQSLRNETQLFSTQAHMLCGPLEGHLLGLLVKISGAKQCLELGTFTGYSALHIASQLPVDGTLITCEINEDHARFAQGYFDKSPHGHKIEVRIGKASNILPTLELNFDFVFIDANKADSPLYYDLILPKVRSNGLIVVDNALYRGKVIEPASTAARAIDALNRKARQDPLVETVLLPVRDGILLIRKR